MRKFIGVLLSVLCICCAAIGLTGCKKDKHIHAFDKQVITDEYKATDATCTEAATYYYSCECGEKGAEIFTSGNALGHSFTNYISDNNATCTQDGTKTAKCDRDGCNEKDTVTDTDSKLPHTFDKQVANEKYLASAATCTEAAKYYYSCSCGEKGTQTFTSGNALGHSYSSEWTTDENYHWHIATCEHANETTVKEVHIAGDWIIDIEATYEQAGQKHKECTVCKKVLAIEELPQLPTDKITFNTLAIDDNNSAYIKVANAETNYNFTEEISVSGNAEYVVALDVNGIYRSLTNVVPLTEGENIFYVFEMLSGKIQNTYTITIRRRPIYTVTFNTTGGTAVNSQSIEEDAIIPEPVTTRAGYTFKSWSYDFTQPIIENTIITAAWTANTNTAYKVEYYLENLEDNNYTLIETENLQGTTDTTATAEIKTYDHFTFNEMKSISSGNVSCDGSLVLKVYYTRNTYTLSNANTSYGEITNATTKKYGNDKIDSVATEYLGCKFLGWYKGEELLSIEKEYTFTVEYNVTAKFKVKDEMSNFNFNSSVDTCNITGLKDKIVSEITIPDYVTSIGDGAFRGCNSLASITLPFIGASRTASEGYKQVFGYIFGYTTTSGGSSVSGATYQYNYYSIYYYYYIPTSLKTFTLSDSVTSIGVGAFYGCSGLTSVTIPDSVTSIGRSAFYKCSGLTSVTIPDSVTYIGEDAFSGCNGLTSVTIGSGVTSIGWYAFSGCSGLTSVTIPDSVTSIGDNVFDGCSGLTSVTIPDSVTSIGGGAFFNSGLTSVTIGSGVTSIGDGAFGGCYKLVEVINKSDFNITKGSSDNGRVAYYALNVKKDGISDIVNKDGYLFYTYDNVNYLLAYVGSNTDLTLPDDYNGQNYEVNNYAFFNSGLTSVTIPDSVTSIGNYAFEDCSGLTSVTIGNSVTSIGDRAFSNCSGIESLVVTAGNKKYHSANNCIIKTGTKQLIVGCNTSIIPSDGSVTSIGHNAFWGCSGLTSVTIPDRVTSIGDSAFYGCSGLTSVTIPDSVTSIGDSAFRGCSGLTSVTIPDSVTSIGWGAFIDCSGLTSVTIGNSVTSIGRSAFSGCRGLTSITYKGTIADWKKINKGSSWNANVPTTCVIHCTDGDIKLFK